MGLRFVFHRVTAAVVSPPRLRWRGIVASRWIMLDHIGTPTLTAWFKTFQLDCQTPLPVCAPPSQAVDALRPISEQGPPYKIPPY
jgi:hypothetical protein